MPGIDMLADALLRPLLWLVGGHISLRFHTVFSLTLPVFKSSLLRRTQIMLDYGPSLTHAIIVIECPFKDPVSRVLMF